jgi:hypothetical protein
MAPFTTYMIPEADNEKTVQSGKWLLIITNQPVLPIQTELLQKICQALNADYSSHAEIQIYDATGKLSLSGRHSRNIKLILSFGIQPSQLGIWLDLEKPGIQFLESFSFILSVTLDELINHPNSKKQLWSSMQSYLQFTEERKQN